MNLANRTYTAQDIIELFNGDQIYIFDLISRALNSGEDVAAIIKREIAHMDLDADDATDLAHVALNGTPDEVDARHRAQHVFGMARTSDFNSYD